MFKIMPFFPKLLSCPVFVHLAQFSYIDKTTDFSTKTLDANSCVSHPAACLSCFLFDLWINIGFASNVWCTKQMVIRWWMFNRPCSVDFLVPQFWAASLMLNPPSRTSFTTLVKVVDRLLFCMLQLLREGLYKIRRFPSVSAHAFTIAKASLPFPLTLTFLSYFCKCLLESQRSEKIGKTGKLTIFQGVCQHFMHTHLP